MKIFLILALLFFPAVVWAEDAILEYSAGDESYLVIIQDNRVVGGFAQGSAPWEVWGGAKMGDRLQVIFVRNDGNTGDNAWWSHTYRISGRSVILETSVAKSGRVVTNREGRYSIDRYEIK